MSNLWLPEGGHNYLNIEHAPSNSAGEFTGGGWKLVWHITVSPWMAVDSMVNVLQQKNAAPHLVIGGRPGYRYPVVVQMLPFNEAGRALANNPYDGHQTNRANCIQVEICARPGNTRERAAAVGEFPVGSELFDLPGVEVATMRDGLDGPCMDADQARLYTSGVAGWTHDTYKALANLAFMVSTRVEIPTRLARRFTNTSRFSDTRFETTEGHLGHMHVPDNDHSDPTTAFKGGLLMTYLRGAPIKL